MVLQINCYDFLYIVFLNIKQSIIVLTQSSNYSQVMTKFLCSYLFISMFVLSGKNMYASYPLISLSRVFFFFLKGSLGVIVHHILKILGQNTIRLSILFRQYNILKLLCRLVKYFYLSLAFLALPNAQKICRMNPNLRKACSFQECTPLCLQKYNMDGICIGNNKKICTCIYDC